MKPRKTDSSQPRSARTGNGRAAHVAIDPECRVYGVAGLRVADASVMPSVPSANTNFPTIMISERVADFIRAARRSG